MSATEGPAMRFDTSQQMRLSQQMKLAPRMIQSMEILQLPLLALQERIEQELESNITLELVEPVREAPERSGDGQTDDDGPPPDRELDVGDGAHDFERLDTYESSYAEASENDYSAASLKRFEEYTGHGSARRYDGERDSKMDAMANTAARGESLNEQLARQWSLVETDERTRALGDLLIAFLDADGYLRTALEDVADRAPERMKPVTVEELAGALAAVQIALDPPGVAAQTLPECLLLQLDALEREDGVDRDLERLLIGEHLDDILQNRLPKVAEKTGLPMQEITDAIGRMRRLDPAPGRVLVDEAPPAVVADAILEYDEEEDRYIAYLNDRVLPNLRINREYAKMVRDRQVDKPTRDFIRTNISNAEWLLDAVEQRKRTLVRVLNVVAEAQRDFFDQGPQSLRPLPMTQVADQLGVHVATVSRAVSGKYVQTPRGVFPLRRFFSGGTQTEAGEDVSWDAIKAALQEVVDSEDKANPLSDEALADALKEKGIDIARRTVAKYRSQLSIPSARMRKKY
jgi:RNA polymerase sigma-54 factor